MSPTDLLALPPHERLALIEALWDSLGEAPPLPAAQAAELANRLQSFAQDRPAAVTWDALKAELEQHSR
jgi:putative addiction module component (TIGR02574 family)